MIEITNKQKSPIQLVIKSRKQPHSMTCLNLPGIGSGKNVYYLSDELTTEYVERAERKYKLITTKYIPNRELNKGE
jgi:hypothetical protein